MLWALMVKGVLVLAVTQKEDLLTLETDTIFVELAI